MTANASGVVLVHGANHGSWCWARTVPLLRAPTVAVDLPGRAGRPAPNGSQVFDALVLSLVEQVRAAAVVPRVLVGHSLGGLFLPALACAFGHQVQHLVYVSAIVPTRGADQASLFPPLVRNVVRSLSRTGRGGPEDSAFTRWLMRRMMCNDLGRDDAAWLLARVHNDLPGLAGVRATVGDAEVNGVARTYVRLARDRTLAPKRQAAMVERLPAGSTKVVIDAGHDVMVGQPAQLADVINRCS